MNDLLGAKLSAKQELDLIAEAYNATEPYEEWIKILKRKKASLSEWAWKCRLREMQKLMTAGSNPYDVWAKSALSGWTGLYAVKKDEYEKKPEFDLSQARPGESMEQFEARMRNS